MSTMFWIWMAAAVVFLIFEILTPGPIFACFAAAAAASGIYAQFMPGEYYWQIGIFVGASIILLPSMRPVAKRLIKPSPTKSNVDALIGKTAVVIKDIDPDTGGQIRVEGQVWAAQADEPIAAKSRVTITAVSGTRLIVTRAETERTVL